MFETARSKLLASPQLRTPFSSFRAQSNLLLVYQEEWDAHNPRVLSSWVPKACDLHQSPFCVTDTDPMLVHTGSIPDTSSPLLPCSSTGHVHFAAALVSPPPSLCPPSATNPQPPSPQPTVPTATLVLLHTYPASAQACASTTSFTMPAPPFPVAAAESGPCCASTPTSSYRDVVGKVDNAPGPAAGPAPPVESGSSFAAALLCLLPEGPAASPAAVSPAAAPDSGFPGPASASVHDHGPAEAVIASGLPQDAAAPGAWARLGEPGPAPGAGAGGDLSFALAPIEYAGVERAAAHASMAVRPAGAAGVPATQTLRQGPWGVARPAGWLELGRPAVAIGPPRHPPRAGAAGGAQCFMVGDGVQEAEEEEGGLAVENWLLQSPVLRPNSPRSDSEAFAPPGLCAGVEWPATPGSAAGGQVGDVDSWLEEAGEAVDMAGWLD
jgi:hypothetical protein